MLTEDKSAGQSVAGGAAARLFGHPQDHDLIGQDSRHRPFRSFLFDERAATYVCAVPRSTIVNLISLLLVASGELTGATNLIQHHNLEHSFNKFCGRKVKDQLSSFLPNLPGNIDGPAKDSESSLRRLIERPPITSIEIVPLTKTQLDSAFRLHVGPVSCCCCLPSLSISFSLFLTFSRPGARAISLHESNIAAQEAQAQTPDGRARRCPRGWWSWWHRWPPL